jgi:hypothetical protein
MKNLMITLLVAFTGFFAKAQQEELINNTWYLEKVVISGTEHYIPTSYPDPTIIRTEFYDDHFFAGVCFDFFSADVSSYTSTEIIVQGRSEGLMDCPQFPDYNDFKNLYYFPVLSNDWAQSAYALGYLIENIGIYKRLTLTNSNGDTAVYYNYNFLSTADLRNKTDGITLFPNPVKGILTIEGGKLKIENARIYDLSGKLVKTFSGNSVNVSDLQKGTYLLMIDGKSFKFIKQ